MCEKVDGREFGYPNTWNGDAYINISVHDHMCKISMATIKQMMEHFTFDAVKKRVHTHLENPELIR